ncbi:hypothetical protein KJ359_003217 [Pestalotiopsis sp. 9143b]|nr:hypothetical protein KJ359_003217 [Pestalotiopsis sp. 9143b]
MPSATTQSSAATPWQDSLQGLWSYKTTFVFDMTKYRKQTSATSIAGKCPTFRSSQTEEVCGTPVKAKFWYDGRNLNNAKEDAAEAALTWLTASGY